MRKTRCLRSLQSFVQNRLPLWWSQSRPYPLPPLQPDPALRFPSLENTRTVSEAKLTGGGHSQARSAKASIHRVRLRVHGMSSSQDGPVSLAAFRPGLRPTGRERKGGRPASGVTALPAEPRTSSPAKPPQPKAWHTRHTSG